MGSSQSSFKNVIPLSLDGHTDATLKLSNVMDNDKIYLGWKMLSSTPQASAPAEDEIDPIE